MIPKFPRYQRRSRRAAAIVESTIVLAVCLLMLLGMLELSIALMRHTVMSETARRVARAAIIHGAKATTTQGHWGPAPLAITAAADHPAATEAQVALMTLDPADVRIDLTWPDGDNQPDQRVQVTVNYTHAPIVPIPGWYSQLDLQAVSTMRIAH